MGVLDTVINFIKKSNEDINKLPEIFKVEDDKSTTNQETIRKTDDLVNEKVLKSLLAYGKDEDQDDTTFNNKPKSISEQISEIYKDAAIPQERVKYYQQIDELYNSFPIARRIVRQYNTSICRQDPISNKIITLKKNDADLLESLDDYFIDVVENKIQYLILYYSLEDKIKNRIVPYALKYGNCFIEIIDKNAVLNIDEVLEESVNSVKHATYLNNRFRLLNNTAKTLLEDTHSARDLNKNYNEHLEYLKDLSDVLVETSIDKSYFSNGTQLDIDNITDEQDVSYDKLHQLSQLTLFEQSNENNNKDNKEDDKLAPIISLYQNINKQKLIDIAIKIHHPKHVLIIHDGNKILGYLVFESQETQSTSLQDVAKYLYQLFNPSKTTNKSLEQVSKDLYEKFIKFVKEKVITKFEKELQTITDDDEKIKIILQALYKYDKEVYYIIRDIFVHEKLSKIRVRFVPADKMVNFILDTENWPYGQSVIESLLFYSKLYLLTLLSNVITKLSRASVIRKWILDVGVTQQHGNLVQKLRRELTNKIITVDSIGSLQAIPRILTDYKDLITLQKNGKAFVDFTVQQAGDPSVDIQDLDFLKQEIITLSNIPSPYLGMVDTVELREQLVTANIIWAETITYYQHQLSSKLSELIDKIFIVVNKKDITDLISQNKDIILPSDVFKVSLIQPVMLQLQYIDAIFTSISNTLQLLSSTPQGQKIDVIKFLQKYVPTINWNEFIMSDEDYEKQELEQKLQSNTQQQSQQSNSPF